MHSRWWTAPNFDNYDPDLNSFMIIVENMDVKAHPQGRVTNFRIPAYPGIVIELKKNEI